MRLEPESQGQGDGAQSLQHSATLLSVLDILAYLGRQPSRGQSSAMTQAPGADAAHTPAQRAAFTERCGTVRTGTPLSFSSSRLLGLFVIEAEPVPRGLRLLRQLVPPALEERRPGQSAGCRAAHGRERTALAGTAVLKENQNVLSWDAWSLQNIPESSARKIEPKWLSNGPCNDGSTCLTVSQGGTCPY